MMVECSLSLQDNPVVNYTKQQRPATREAFMMPNHQLLVADICGSSFVRAHQHKWSFGLVSLLD
jgi:hypothetical protein